MTGKQVFVAMSGGVDSSLSAYLLKEAGYRVTGIHLELAEKDRPVPETEHSLLEQTCRLLGVPLHYLQAETYFKEKVIDYFCEEYGRGRTPNPCVRCNRNIKFGLLLERVLEMGGDYLATGHYARIEASSDGQGYRLLKGRDRTKDQSYFLYVLGQKELSRVLFPVGELQKARVKEMAAALGLPPAGGKESQDICFLPDGDYHGFIARHINPQPGEIVDAGGRVVGRHRGLAYYTIGQRQGTGVSSGGRLYVTGMDAGSNRLIIGTEEELYKTRLTARDLNWISGKAPEGKREVSCKIRYRSPEAEAAVEVRGDRAEVVFKEPQRAIAPGQSVVFYEGEKVLGGGIIDEAG